MPSKRLHVFQRAACKNDFASGSGYESAAAAMRACTFKTKRLVNALKENHNGVGAELRASLCHNDVGAWIPEFAAFLFFCVSNLQALEDTGEKFV